MLKNLSLTNGFHLRRAMTNFDVAAALLLMLVITASAYTLVLRNGQRLEIPSEFTLTKVTLTYEISPGFNKTMQLILIDVAATERANHEAPGSFFKHTEERSEEHTSELQSQSNLVCRLLLEKKKKKKKEY